MKHHFLRRSLWQILVVALGVGVVISISACAPGGTDAAPRSTSGAGVLPQGAATGTTPQSTASATGLQAIVNGQVVAGPTCPVALAEQPCPPKPVPNREVLIENLRGAIVTRVTTDRNGKFTVTLAPGTYIFLVPSGSSPFPVQRQSQRATVAAGQTVQVQILLDSGIR